jgi:hypothetical protein
MNIIIPNIDEPLVPADDMFVTAEVKKRQFMM